MWTDITHATEFHVVGCREDNFPADIPHSEGRHLEDTAREKTDEGSVSGGKLCCHLCVLEL